MAPPALFPHRRALIFAALGVPVALRASAAELVPRFSGDAVCVAAPGLHFLEGKTIDRLRDGLPVSFDFHLSLLSAPDRNPLRQAFERFTISYDLWEEKFSVVRRGVLRKASRLSARAAEAWCLDNLAAPVAGLPPERKVHVRLEVRQAEMRDGKPVLSDPGLSLTGLVEIFSRPARANEARWAVETGPLSLDEIGRPPRGAGFK